MKYQYYKSVIQPFGPLASVSVPPFVQTVTSDYFLIRSSSLQPIQASFASLPPSKTKTNFYGENATLFGQSDYYIVPDTLVPFTIYSSSVNSGVTQVFQTLFLPNYELNDLHRDTYADFIQAPLQGPFTEGWVGGNFQRHIEINTIINFQL